ncbi:MAG: amino acid adenylation domain-containing protein, partial [Rubrivivax sp.]
MNDLAATARLTEVDYDPFASEELARAVPTTEAQRELWLADQLGSEASLAYNESITMTLAGALQLQALQDALLALTDRHEALRSTISEDGMAMLIAPRGRLQATMVDLSTCGAEARAEALARLKIEAVEKPFDLVRGPLMRATLVKLAVDRHELLVTAHHIVCDGWSFGVVAKDISTLYDAIANHRSGTALAVADSFSDYALGQLEPEQARVAEADLRYWVGVYDKSVPVVDLPPDRSRRAVRSFDSSRVDLAIDKAIVDAVRKAGSKQGASLFVTLFALFAALIARLSGSDEVVVGVPAAGQSAQDKKTLVGHCVNLLPIRLSVDLDTSIDELLVAARASVLDAYEHQNATFGSVLKKLQVERDTSRLPLVSVLFNVDASIESDALSLPGLEVRVQSNPRQYEIFDLFLNATQTDGALVLECQYNAALFDRQTIERWLDLYREAMQRAAVQVSGCVADALAPTDGDLALLAGFNRTALDVPAGLRIHEMIERQANLTPDALAVVSADRRVSYRELDERANGVAMLLRERGVAPGDLIGLSCGRSHFMLVGLLGILKSGAGYVPLDPSFPADRLAFMADDASLRQVLSDRSVAGEWKFPSSERIDLDDVGRSTSRPATAGSSDDVAYVIYTSGSTGWPKGVQVPHRSVVNLLESVRREPGMTSQHVVLSVTTLSFDIAVSEVILPLTVGATVVVANRAQATDGDRLRTLIESSGVNFIDATPSTWRLLLAAGWQGSPALKAICTGEPLPPDLGSELIPIVGELWNGYGPTETTVWSSFHRVERAKGLVPIGRPIANTQFHVVDSKLRRVPVGVVGEFFIGGAGVTLGYLKRPDLTAERFLPDPFAGRHGACWYRTGDLGRWRADGVLECLGRTDNQVKVRGYRIELGEIEAVCEGHRGVARAVVMAREDSPGDVRLVAYLMASVGMTVEEDALRATLRARLPDYMLPQHV